ncbi:MAG: O-antigen ligase family protein [Bacteroidetes bacterium]|nr:O-antigen ligase family protein [Bacteroidota bacterium]
MNGVSFFDWIREYSIMSLVLFYLPIRYYFSEEKYLKRLLILLAVVCILTDLQQFYDYYQISKINIVYAYQILITRNINQTLFTSASAFGILFLLSEKKFNRQMILMAFTTLNTLALISSFSRTYWIILIFEILLFFIILPVKQKFKLATYLIIFSSVITLTVMIAFRGGAFVALQAIERRLETSTKGRKDPSVQSRFAEYKAVLNKISDYPFSGNGLSNKIRFMEPIKNEAKNTTTIHNGYFYLFHRIGIPLSLFYLFFLIYFTINSFVVYLKCKVNLYKILSLEQN